MSGTDTTQDIFAVFLQENRRATHAYVCTKNLCPPLIRSLEDSGTGSKIVTGLVGFACGLFCCAKASGSSAFTSVGTKNVKENAKRRQLLENFLITLLFFPYESKRMRQVFNLKDPWPTQRVKGIN